MTSREVDVIDVERKYPNDLAERVRESWPADAYPLPERLVTILDVAYHASFLRDEERPVTARIFGAEIAGDLPPVTNVRRAMDLEADTFVTERVDTVGTRHRSAYRFCTAVPDAVAVVVSQDGGVQFVNRHREAITYWDHGLGGN